LVQTLLDLKELGIYPCCCGLYATSSFLDLDNHWVSSERTRVSPLEFVDLGPDSAEIFGLHDVDQFTLLLEALDSIIGKVLDEWNGTFSPDDSSVLDPAFMECSHGLACKVTLHV